jgi:aminoglycoside phosphotransferase (APT) family kinase protein
VLHNDVWGNVLQRPDTQLALLDWRESEIGDYHDDVARNINMLWLVPQALPLPGLRDVIAWIWGLVGRRYRRRYAMSRPLDSRRIHYWAGLQSLEFALASSVGGAHLPWR